MKNTIRLLTYVLLSCPAFASLAIADTQPPNILYIMMDDLDISDVGAYGSPDIVTETIDSVAAEGMRFEQYYVNSPVCAPTEASIITGQHPSRFGLKRAVVPESMRGVPGDATSIAQMLKTSGYRTAHIGKWLMGTRKPEFLPLGKGFDHSVRLVTDKYLGYSKYEISVDEAAPVLYENAEHLTSVLTDAAVQFIEASQAGNPRQPFFLNLWYFAPHQPIEPPKDFDNSKTRYCLSAEPTSKNCDSRRGDYAALVTHADRQIKRVLDTLGKLGLTDNTLIMITSDNGGGRPWHPQDILPNRNLRGFKAGVFDGGIRVPLVARWPEEIPVKSVNRSVLASFDTFPTFAQIAHADVEKSRLDGESFADVLQNNSLKRRRDPLIWENKISNTSITNSSGILNTYAIRQNDWKLVFNPATDEYKTDALMLFNLADDPAEKHNLAASSERLLHQFSLLDYRVTISEAADKNQVMHTSQSDIVVNQLQSQYFHWRQETGTIDYELQLSASGVTQSNNVLVFAGGFASAARNTRFDFHDGDFTFITEITAENVERRAVVAEKPGSWRMFVESGKLKLEVYAEDTAAGATEIVKLAAPIKPNEKYHVAFTVYGFRDSGSSIQLYLNGNPVDQFSDASVEEGEVGIKQVRSIDDPDKPMIFIGNSASGELPFHGSIETPRMSVLCLYPGEVFWDYSDLTF